MPTWWLIRNRLKISFFLINLDKNLSKIQFCNRYTGLYIKNKPPNHHLFFFFGWPPRQIPISIIGWGKVIIRFASKYYWTQKFMKTYSTSFHWNLSRHRFWIEFRISNIFLEIHALKFVSRFLFEKVPGDRQLHLFFLFSF